MRQALSALTDELRRLKATGVKTVTVSDEALVSIRRAVVAFRQDRSGGAAVATATTSASAPAPLPPPAPVRAAVPEPTVAPPRPPPAPAVMLPVVAAASLPPAPTVTLPEGDKATRWQALLAKVQADPVCRENVRPGKKVVLGVGSLDARIMFVGEAPGSEEEIAGEPFVGPAGQLLTKMISAMGLKREQVYIGNIMNWRPQLPTVDGREQVGNRPPTEAEMRYCLPYLKAQIDVVQPELLVALGSTAAQGLLGFGAFKALGEVRGRWRDFNGRPLMVTYHPSYILRNQSNRSKRMIWEDLLQVMERAGLAVSYKQRGYFLEK